MKFIVAKKTYDKSVQIATYSTLDAAKFAANKLNEEEETDLYQVLYNPFAVT